MKKILIIVFTLCCFFSSSHSQSSFDRINIYIYPQYISIGMGDKCTHNEDYTRVNASIKIYIIEKNIIEQFKEVLLESEKKIKSDEKDQFVCQVVIDFIKSERVQRTIAIDNLKNIKMDNESIIYNSSFKITQFLQSNFPYYIR